MPTKKETIELDYSRQVTEDLRDPRCNSWPCKGQHVAGRKGANNWASWQHCQRCGLRLSYIPRKGAPADNTKNPNPTMVKRALQALHDELPKDMEPSEELVKVMLEKVTAEERMSTLLEEYKIAWKKNKKKIIKAKEALESPKTSTQGYAPQRSQPSSPEWEKVSHYNPESENLLQYLNMEEMESLRALAAQRARDQSKGSQISDTELEPDYTQQ